jgi:hypothetical protein
MSHLMHFLKNCQKIETILKKKETLFRKSMSNSSYTYRMKGKLMSAGTKFDGETRECVHFFNQITTYLKFFEKLYFRKFPKIEFVDISSKIGYLYHLQIGNLHHQTSISFF